MNSSSIQEQDSLTTVINPTEPIDKWLTQEWLLTNGTGSYSSGTLAGINTRRYHGLLNVKFILEGEEECSGQSLADFIRANKSRLACGSD